jgi:hypothetical protein
MDPGTLAALSSAGSVVVSTGLLVSINAWIKARAKKTEADADAVKTRSESDAKTREAEVTVRVKTAEAEAAMDKAIAEEVTALRRDVDAWQSQHEACETARAADKADCDRRLEQQKADTDKQLARMWDQITELRRSLTPGPMPAVTPPADPTKGST